MSLRFFYRPNWRAGDPAIEFTDHVRLYTLDVTEYAEEGSVATSTYLVDDDDGTLDFPPLTRIWAVEGDVAASSNTYVHHGYIADRVIHRGDSALTSSARIWEVSVADENSVLSRRVLSNPNANRPAETDVARVQWLANEADGQLLIDDTAFISTASPTNMDAADYRGQTGLDVLNDCAQQSGKNFYAYFNQLLGTGIWYGAEDLTTYSSMIRLTNVLGDVNHDQNVYEIGREGTRLTRDPSRLLSGVYMQYGAGSGVYVRNQPMFQEIGMRDMVMSAPNVNTLGTATRRAQRYLADLDSEEDRIITTVRLPSSKVTFIKRGMRIRFRATHLPGYESEVWLRVLRCSVANDSEQLDSAYLLTLELGTNSIPPSPVDVPAENPGSAILSADLAISTALGENAWSSGTANLTVGKQYRLVATVTGNLNPPTYGNDHLFQGLSVNLTRATNTTTKFEGAGPPVMDWQGGGAVDTALFNYDFGISWNTKTPIRDGGTAPNNSYSVGSVLTGQWVTYVGPNTDPAQLRLSGSPLSGFYGFAVAASVELQQRDP